jgi:hypothetical protein
VEAVSNHRDPVEAVVREGPPARRQLDDDAHPAVVEDAGLVGIDQRLALGDAAEPRVRLRSAHELRQCASAVRRGAVAGPEQPDRAALGKQLERRVAQPLDDNDLERRPGRPRPSSGGARRNERDAGENENGEQGKDADRPDHRPDSQRTT